MCDFFAFPNTFVASNTHPKAKSVLASGSPLTSDPGLCPWSPLPCFQCTQLNNVDIWAAQIIAPFVLALAPPFAPHLQIPSAAHAIV